MSAALQKVKRISEHVAEQEPSQFEQLRALIAKTDRKDAKERDVADLRKFLDDHPSLWHAVGDLAVQALYGAIDEIQCTPPMTVSLKKGVEEMRKELGYNESSMIERLLIDRVLLCWLRMNLIEVSYTRDTMTGDGCTLTKGLYLEKRMTAAHVRYERALTSLAKVRRLLQPRLRSTADALQSAKLLNASTAGGESAA